MKIHLCIQALGPVKGSGHHKAHKAHTFPRVTITLNHWESVAPFDSLFDLLPGARALSFLSSLPPHGLHQGSVDYFEELA